MTGVKTVLGICINSVWVKQEGNRENTDFVQQQEKHNTSISQSIVLLICYFIRLMICSYIIFRK